MKKINGPTRKLTLCDIIIEHFGIIFTNIRTCTELNKSSLKILISVVGSKLWFGVNFMI